jgi:uncharacterized membrane protein
MEPHLIALVVAALLVALTAGFLFGFAVVVMPGFGRLRDREYLRAFQAVDGIIQDGQPIFGVVVGGSAVALAVATALSFGKLGGADRGLLVAAAVAYVAGGVIPTAAVNLPLNNRLVAEDVHALDDDAAARIRAEFEQRWNRANNVRTVVLTAAAAALIVILARTAG